MTYELEFFFVLKVTNIVHLAQFAYLTQGQPSLAQLTQLRLAVVLANILISTRVAMIQFIENHVVFIRWCCHLVALQVLLPPVWEVPLLVLLLLVLLLLDRAWLLVLVRLQCQFLIQLG